LVTGSWSLKASLEATRLVGEELVNVVTDGRAGSGKFGTIPPESEWKLSPREKQAFVYFCDNETVDGVEFPAFPKVLDRQEEEFGRPIVVADMSSNILSRPVDVNKYSLLFFGAQKNLGTTGITVIIVKKALIGPGAPPKLMRTLGLPVGPSILDYATAAKNNSLYNTLSIFDVWVAGEVLRRLLATYPDEKVMGMGKVAFQKAQLLYTALERFPGIYRVVPDAAVRSRMNVCFRVKGGDPEVEKEWLKGAEERGLMGLKGHRSVGGIRASNCMKTLFAWSPTF
jgi:phosphoserine aminotransferase